MKSYSDLPDITLQQIQRFFEHYKDSSPANGSRCCAGAGPEDAHKLIEDGIARAKGK